MCGRYTVYDLHLLGQMLANLPLSLDIPLQPTWNAAPSQLLPVLVETKDEERVDLTSMNWGLVPRWTKPGEKPKVTPINARAETLAEKPMFRGLVRGNRCIVPTNGFYEWKREGSTGKKQPWYIHLRDEPIMFLAGLYDEAKREDGSPLRSYTIVTTRANDAMADLHDRMPVIVPPEDVEHWLSRSEPDLAALEYLLEPAPDNALALHPVSPAVNSPAHDTPDLIEPLEDVEQPDLF